MWGMARIPLLAGLFTSTVLLTVTRTDPSRPTAGTDPGTSTPPAFAAPQFGPGAPGTGDNPSIIPVDANNSYQVGLPTFGYPLTLAQGPTATTTDEPSSTTPAVQDPSTPKPPAAKAPLIPHVPGSTYAARTRSGQLIDMPHMYIVGYKQTVTDPYRETAQMAAQYGMTVNHVYAGAVNGFAAVIPEEVIGQVLNDPRVDYIERDRFGTTPSAQITVGPATTQMWNLFRMNAQNSSQASGDGTGSVGDVTVAILDTGIQYTHPDLNVDTLNSRNFVASEASTPLALTADDGNLVIHGHGTAIAGCVAARDNDIAVVGVAPGARLWAVKVVTTLFTSAVVPSIALDPWYPRGMIPAPVLSDLVAGMNYVANSGGPNRGQVQVALITFNFPATTAGIASLTSAISVATQRGVVVVVAAGDNERTAVAPATQRPFPTASTRDILAPTPPWPGESYPNDPITGGGRLQENILLLNPVILPCGDPNVIPVAGYRNAAVTTFIPFSVTTNYGQAIALNGFVAPGGQFDLNNTLIGGDDFIQQIPCLSVAGPPLGTAGYPDNVLNTSGSATGVGTCFAAAHVAGLAALIKDPDARRSHRVRSISSILNPKNANTDTVRNLIRSTQGLPIFQSRYGEPPLPYVPITDISPF
jgi:hypothetical protein